MAWEAQHQYWVEKANQNVENEKIVDEIVSRLQNLSTRQQMELNHWLAPSHKKSDLSQMELYNWLPSSHERTGLSREEGLKKFFAENPDMVLKLITVLLKQKSNLNKEIDLLNEMSENDMKAYKDHLLFLSIFQDYLKEQYDATHPNDAKK